MEALKFAAGTDDVIEGWGAPIGGPFNGRDLDGERFVKTTDFCLPWFDVRPVLWNHGLDEDAQTTVVGRVKAHEMRDAGLWVQAQLDKQSQYFDAIKQMVDKGALYFSSGAMQHLVDVDRKSGDIKRWPWVELSLTSTPANLLATLDFATAEKHFKSAGLDVDALKAKLDAAARDALPDSDFAYIDSKGERHLPINDEAHVRAALSRFDQTSFDSDADKEAARKKIMARAKELGVDVSADDTASKSASIKSMEGSYEDLIEDLSCLLNPQSPFGPDCYTCTVATFPDYVIVSRYEYGADSDDAQTYWKVSYSIGEDGEPVLGTAEQVEQTYVPAKSYTSESPLTLDATNLSRHAGALSERTKDLQERRIKEGRVLSTSNRQKLADAVTTLDAAKSAIQTLLDASDQLGRDQAEAKALTTPDALQRRLAALDLFIRTIPAD